MIVKEPGRTDILQVVASALHKKQTLTSSDTSDVGQRSLKG